MLLTSAQARARLQIGRDKLRELISEGELTAIKHGDAPNSPYRITEESIADYVERRTVQAAQ